MLKWRKLADVPYRKSHEEVKSWCTMSAVFTFVDYDLCPLHRCDDVTEMRNMASKFTGVISISSCIGVFLVMLIVYFQNTRLLLLVLFLDDFGVTSKTWFTRFHLMKPKDFAMSVFIPYIYNAHFVIYERSINHVFLFESIFFYINHFKQKYK